MTSRHAEALQLVREHLDWFETAEQVGHEDRAAAALTVVEKAISVMLDQIDPHRQMRARIQAEADAQRAECRLGADDFALQAPRVLGDKPSLTGPNREQTSGVEGWFTFRCSGEHAATGRVNVYLGEEETAEETIEAAKVPGAAGACGRDGCAELLVLAITDEEAEAVLGRPEEVHGTTGYDEDHECVNCGGRRVRAGWLCESCSIWAEEGHKEDPKISDNGTEEN